MSGSVGTLVLLDSLDKISRRRSTSGKSSSPSEIDSNLLRILIFDVTIALQGATFEEPGVCTIARN
jgi:hypothetical protein